MGDSERGDDTVDEGAEVEETDDGESSDDIEAPASATKSGAGACVLGGCDGSVSGALPNTTFLTSLHLPESISKTLFKSVGTINYGYSGNGLLTLPPSLSDMVGAVNFGNGTPSEGRVASINVIDKFRILVARSNF